MALTATLIILPIHLSLKGLTSVESYIKDSEFTSELTDVINDEIRDEDVSLDQKINHYSTVKMADNGRGMMIKGV